MKKYTQEVLVVFHNCEPFVDKLQSDHRITWDRVLRYYEVEHDFDRDRDSLTFIDQNETYDDLDEWEQDHIETEDESCQFYKTFAL